MPKLRYYIPIIIIPYYIVFLIVCIFTGFLENVFQNNPIFMLAPFVLLWIIALVFAITLSIISRKRKWDAQRLTRINMTIKLIQIPAYIVIFLLGLIFLITIFTMGFSLVFMLFDCMSILLTGIVGASAAGRCRAEGVLSTGGAVLNGILQFFFCVDIISAIIIFSMAKSVKKKIAVNSK